MHMSFVNIHISYLKFYERSQENKIKLGKIKFAMISKLNKTIDKVKPVYIS